MPSWPAETKYIGHSTTRIDGAAKVTGKARYSSDIQANGWLYGMILRSKWPAAKISDINLEKALKVPGIKAAVLARSQRTHGALLRRGTRGCGRHQQAGVPRRIEGHRSHGATTAVRRQRGRCDQGKFAAGLGKIRQIIWRRAPAIVAKWTRRSAVLAAVIEGFYSAPVQIHNQWKRWVTRSHGQMTA